MDYTTEKGHHLTIALCQNIDIFESIAKLNIVKPKVPTYYIKERDQHIENPNHPLYGTAMDLYNVEKAVVARKAAILLAIPPDKKIIAMERETNIRYKFTKTDDESIWANFINEHVNDNDMYEIINLCFLTENYVYTIFNTLVSTVTRANKPALDVRIKNSVNTTISVDSISLGDQYLVHPVDEYTAMSGSGLNYIEWVKLAHSEKAKILALHRVSTLIENHQQDEVQEEMNRKSK